MLALRELVLILDQDKSISLQNWLFKNNGTNLVKLYYGLLNGTFATDDQASIALYDKAGAAAFHKLKYDLRTQLYDFIPFINIKLKRKGDAEEERFRYHNQLMSFNILSHLSGDAAALEMGENIFENCVKYGFTDLAYIAAKRILGKISSPKKLSFYIAEAKRLHHIDGIELEAKTYYDEIMLLYRNDKLTTEELIAFTQAKRDAFMQIKGEITSPSIATYTYLLDICVHSARHDAKLIFDTATEAAHYFEQLPIRNAQALKTFYYYLIVGYTQRKQFDTAQQYMVKCLACVSEGTTTWLKVLELSFVSYLHSGDYSLAISTWQKATSDKFMQSLGVHTQEKWAIYYAFLHFLVQSNAYQPTEKDSKILKSDFKLSKFKNNLVFYDKEKSGMNLNIQLVEILILIIEKQYETLSDRYEAIQKSAQRYIDESALMSRIRLIFKLLLLCIKHDFKYDKIIVAANPTLISLQTQSIELGDEAYELEIMPYEKIWEIVMESLKK